MSARRPLTLAASGLALLGMAACQKPTPAVTFVAGTHRARTAASVFCWKGSVPKDQQNLNLAITSSSTINTGGDECQLHAGRVAVLKVHNGDLIGIDVDQRLTKRGWYLVDLDHAQRGTTITQHHAQIVADFSNATTKGQLNLEVQSGSTDQQDESPLTGRWKFQLIEE